eukprot:TRINITY_DN10887_c0_g1_i1.p1 TRINITY_DN10887_c0_g1~~TRINITY_DN10887_c0_g1_i1.p1  ORF type:complete len:1273 (+),score=208.78 TRINITY_DN10887_c0_g1_i1:207-3821(+)
MDVASDQHAANLANSITRIDPTSAIGKVHETTLREVWEDNRKIYQDRFLTELPIESFLRSTFKVDQTFDDAAFELMSGFFFDVLPRISGVRSQAEWQALVIAAIGTNLKRALWLLDFACDAHGRRLERSIFKCIDTATNAATVAILEHVIKVCVEQKDKIDDDYREVDLLLPDEKQLRDEDTYDQLSDQDGEPLAQQFRAHQRKVLAELAREPKQLLTEAGSGIGASYIVPRHPVMLLFHQLTVDVPANVSRNLYREQMSIVSTLFATFASLGRAEAIALSGSCYLSNMMKTFVAKLDPTRPDLAVYYKHPTPAVPLVKAVRHCVEAADKRCLNDNDGDGCSEAADGYCCVSPEFAKCLTDLTSICERLKPFEFYHTCLVCWDDESTQAALAELAEFVACLASLDDNAMNNVAHYLIMRIVRFPQEQITSNLITVAARSLAAAQRKSPMLSARLGQRFANGAIEFLSQYEYEPATDSGAVIGSLLIELAFYNDFLIPFRESRESAEAFGGLVQRLTTSYNRVRGKILRTILIVVGDQRLRDACLDEDDDTNLRSGFFPTTARPELMDTLGDELVAMLPDIVQQVKLHHRDKNVARESLKLLRACVIRDQLASSIFEPVQRSIIDILQTLNANSSVAAGSMSTDRLQCWRFVASCIEQRSQILQKLVGSPEWRRVLFGNVMFANPSQPEMFTYMKRSYSITMGLINTAARYCVTHIDKPLCQTFLQGWAKQSELAWAVKSLVLPNLFQVESIREAIYSTVQILLETKSFSADGLGKFLATTLDVDWLHCSKGLAHYLPLIGGQYASQCMPALAQTSFTKHVKKLQSTQPLWTIPLEALCKHHGPSDGTNASLEFIHGFFDWTIGHAGMTAFDSNSKLDYWFTLLWSTSRQHNTAEWLALPTKYLRFLSVRMQDHGLDLFNHMLRSLLKLVRKDKLPAHITNKKNGQERLACIEEAIAASSIDNEFKASLGLLALALKIVMSESQADLAGLLESEAVKTMPMTSDWYCVWQAALLGPMLRWSSPGTAPGPSKAPKLDPQAPDCLLRVTLMTAGVWSTDAWRQSLQHLHDSNMPIVVRHRQAMVERLSTLQTGVKAQVSDEQHVKSVLDLLDCMSAALVVDSASQPKAQPAASNLLPSVPSSSNVRVQLDDRFRRVSQPGIPQVTNVNRSEAALADQADGASKQVEPVKRGAEPSDSAPDAKAAKQS